MEDTAPIHGLSIFSFPPKLRQQIRTELATIAEPTPKATAILNRLLDHAIHEHLTAHHPSEKTTSPTTQELQP